MHNKKNMQNSSIKRSVWTHIICPWIQNKHKVACTYTNPNQAQAGTKSIIEHTHTQSKKHMFQDPNNHNAELTQDYI